MFSVIDSFLNTTTMYRLLTYYLGGLVLVAAGYSALGLLPFSAFNLLASTAFLVALSWLSNHIVARFIGVPTNAESSVLTGLILALVITPGSPAAMFFILFWAAFTAVASKYILNVRGKHMFNPAAVGVAAIALVLNHSATWWVGGNQFLLPFVIVGGLLIVRKIQRTDLVLTFLLSAGIASIAPIVLSGGDVLAALTRTLVHTPLFFFAFVMLTEPLTTPPRRVTRIVYGALVGFLFAPWVHVFSWYSTPELALLLGNVFSYVVSPKFKEVLHLKEIRKLAADTYEFVLDGRLPAFKPGQYAEVTLAADSPDSRGNRRYFTLASSPTEDDVRLGIKFYAKPSTFKRYLAAFKTGAPILAGSIAGDFTLPRNKNQKLAFIAGGIGVTPFRSMVKYLTDTNEKRDVVLLYSNKTQEEIAYKNVFDAAEAAHAGFRAVYTLTDGNVPHAWTGERGFIDAAMIVREVPDYKERMFFISGPRSMVTAFQHVLSDMGVPRRRIKTDFFPGFA
ncbi:RnfABCDGE type electron transport complex subunit D [Candidatus Kaiserbacteria bacterium]|nr:RnfABCDGE type electron transport complex subunit D [Candidatus Kaiserbacteria bacterium]